MDPEVREVGSPLAQGPDVTMRPRTLPLSARAPRQPPLLTRSGQSGAEAELPHRHQPPGGTALNVDVPRWGATDTIFSCGHRDEQRPAKRKSKCPLFRALHSKGVSHRHLRFLEDSQRQAQVRRAFWGEEGRIHVCPDRGPAGALRGHRAGERSVCLVRGALLALSGGSGVGSRDRN